MPYEYKCRQCGREFSHKDRGKKYCSQRCCKEASKRGSKGICANCGKECYVAAYKQGKVRKVFCSFACNMEFQVARRPTRVCKHCGKEFKKKCRSNARYCSVACKLNSEDNIKRLAIMRRKQASRRTTKLELAGYSLLKEMGLDFEPQYVFAGRFVADAYVESRNMILQFDGDYWHGNTDRFPNLTEQQRKQKEVDARANGAARSLGYRVLRIWESDFNDTEGIKRRIAGG